MSSVVYWLKNDYPQKMKCVANII